MDSVPMTTTDMGVNYFANEDKLVPEDERLEFNKDEYKEHIVLDDGPDKYTKQVFQNKDEDEIVHDDKHETTETEGFSDRRTDVYDTVDPEDENHWSKEEAMLRRLDMLRKLGELKQAGVKLSTNYNINSDYKTMKFEYELHNGIRSKQNALGWMSNMMIGIIKGVELLNDNVNPFDIKFDGMWSNSVQADIANYYEVLGELYEKYTTPGKKMDPHLKLCLMLFGSAASIQMQKGFANYIGNSSNVSQQLDEQPDKILEMREKIRQRNEEQKKALAKKFDEEHNKVTGSLEDLMMLKKQQEEYENMKKNNAQNQFASMVMSDASAGSKKRTTMNIPNKTNQLKQQLQSEERKLKEQEEKRNSAVQEIASLTNLQKMLVDMENKGDQIMGNVDDNVSTASSIVRIRNPNIEKLKRQTDTSSVIQKEVVERNVAEKVMDDGLGSISLGNSKDPSAKKKGGRPKKVSLH